MSRSGSILPAIMALIMLSAGSGFAAPVAPKNAIPAKPASIASHRGASPAIVGGAAKSPVTVSGAAIHFKR